MPFARGPSCDVRDEHDLLDAYVDDLGHMIDSGGDAAPDPHGRGRLAAPTCTIGGHAERYGSISR